MINRSMKKAYKVLATVLCLMIAVTFMPSQAFAVSTTGATVDSSHVRVTDDDLEMIKQVFEDFVTESFWGQDISETNYHPDILKEINERYNDMEEILNSATSAEDLGSVDGMFIEINNEDLYKDITIIEALAECTRSVYNDKSDFDKIKQSMIKKIDRITKSVKRSDYNDWYWDQFLQEKAKAKKAIANVNTLGEYYLVVEDLFSFLLSFGGFDDDDSIIIIDFGEGADEGDGIYALYFYNESFLYSNSTLNDMRKAGKRELNSLINDLEKNSEGFKVSDSMKTKVKNFVTKTKTMEVAEDIIKYYETLNDAISEEYGAYLEKTGDTEGLTNSDIIRLVDQMTKVRYAFDKTKYSAAKWEKMDELVEEFEMKLFNTSLKTAAEKLFDTYVAKLQKVPTIKQEIKALRAKYIKKWNKEYKNYKKYKKAKAVPALKKAKAALNKQTTLAGLKKTYKKQTAILDKTIKTFKVTVKKIGKGTVSKSKTVKYGKTYVLTIKPKPGYALKSVTINGKKKPLKYRYSIKIKKKTTIKVVFK